MESFTHKNKDILLLKMLRYIIITTHYVTTKKHNTQNFSVCPKKETNVRFAKKFRIECTYIDGNFWN